MTGVIRLSDCTEEQLTKTKAIFESLTREPEFNDFGLRYDVSLLNELGKGIVLFPLEYIAEFVDKICKSEVDSNANHMIEQFDEFNDDDRVSEMCQSMNATAIGNLAYVALNYSDENVREKAISILNKVHAIEFEKAKSFLN